jgi:PAS domain S-box-containing protein
MSGHEAEEQQSTRDAAAYRIARSLAGGGQVPADLYRLLVQTVRDYAIFALDRTGHVLTWTAGAERLKGYAPHEIIGKHFSIFYPPEVNDAGGPDFELVIADKEGKYEEEGWRVRKDGQRFWASVLITALRDPGGELIGFAKVTRDLTERKHAEEKLRDSEERFRLLVTSVRDYGIFMLDPTGHIASWNAGAERIKGYTQEEILGKHFSVFYPAEDLANDKPAMELRVASKTGRFEDEGWRVKKDGSQFWANVVITALRNAKGELIGFAKVTRDLTERRAAEQRAISDARRIAEAEAANRAKAQFLAAMSHELRTPLNAIGGYADLLILGIHGDITDEQCSALERIRHSQQHLLGLINDLLNFSKIEAGRLTYDIAPFPLGQVSDTVRPMIEPQAASKSIQIQWQPLDESIVAAADRPRVEQILLNLLTNAVKFTQDGGRIVVRHSVLGDVAMLSVEDNGIGIPTDKLGSIFEPFVQVGRTLTSTHEGTGLGLAISRDLARAMGGDLTVESNLGHGSRFTLTLPRP